MSADLIERLQSVENNPYQTMRFMNDLSELAGEAAAEIVRLRGEVATERAAADHWMREANNEHNLNIRLQDIAPAEAKGDELPTTDAEVEADNAKAADAVCLLAIASGYAWDGQEWRKSFRKLMGERGYGAAEYAYTTTPAAQVQQEADFPMTDAQVRQWIGACNHEPARQVLRDYLQLRANTHPAGDALGAAWELVKAWRDRANACVDDFNSGVSGREVTVMRDLANELEAALRPSAGEGKGS